MQIEKEGVYRTRGGEFKRVRVNRDANYPWIEEHGITTWTGDGVHCNPGCHDNLTHYVCPLNSVAPSVVHWQYREIGRIREVGETILVSDGSDDKDNPGVPVFGDHDCAGLTVYASDGNYYLEPLAKPSPPMESVVTPIPESQGEAEVAFKVGDVVACVDDNNTDGELTTCKLYLVTEVLINDLRLHGAGCSWKKKRFRHATPDERRKFFATNPQLHPTEVEPIAQPQPEPWKPTAGQFCSLEGCEDKYLVVGNDQDGDWVVESMKDSELLHSFAHHLYPWIDPPHAVAEFTLNGDKYRAERFGDDEPVTTKVEG